MSKNHNGGSSMQPQESCSTQAQEAVKGAAAGLKDQARDVASTVADKAKGAAAGLKDQARDVASTIADKARDVTEGARETAVAVEHRAEEAVSSLGGRIKNLAGQVRENAPHEGMIGAAAESVACTLDKSGSYLQDNDFAAMAHDVSGVIRTYPIPSVMLGIGLGFLIGRTLRS